MQTPTRTVTLYSMRVRATSLTTDKTLNGKFTSSWHRYLQGQYGLLCHDARLLLYNRSVDIMQASRQCRECPRGISFESSVGPQYSDETNHQKTTFAFGSPSLKVMVQTVNWSRLV
eukprot:429718-Pelagomonas_calceolata.AAC.6